MRRLFAMLAAVGTFALAATGAVAQTPQSLDALNAIPGLQGPNTGTAGRPGWCVPAGPTIGHTTVRLHTQLLVASLSCGGAFGMPDAYQRYLVFTNVHEAALLRARADVERQARADGVDQTAAYDALRTAIANLEADVMSQRGTSVYCSMRESRFYSLIGASPEAFRAYVQDVHGRNMTSGRQCLSAVD